MSLCNRQQFNLPLIELIDQACLRFANKPCLTFGDEQFSYQQVQQESVRVAKALLGSGLQPGMHCAIYSLNSAWAIIVTLGIIRAGGIWLPVNSRNSEADNIATLAQLGCDVLFYQGQFADAAAAVASQNPGFFVSVCLDEQASNVEVAAGNASKTYSSVELHNWLRAAPEVAVSVKREPADILAIPMTGGTTGRAKGVLLSDRNFRALSYGMCDQLVREEGAATYLCAMPLTHVGGRIVLSALPSGARFIIHAGFDAQALLNSIAHEQVTDLFLPPTAIYTLLAQSNVHAFDYSSLRALSYGAAPISVTQLRKALEVFGPVMRGLFGQTECPMMISALTQQDHYVDGAIASDKRLQSVGRASILSELAILDEQGRKLPASQCGEIAVKGDMVCEGYYQNSAETQQTRVNGWHLTGDIGYLDNEGFLFIVDRKKDMIISGGFNVYSAEVEFAITRIKGVAAAAVIGVPSEHWGEEVVAFVTLEPGTSIDEKSVVDFCKEAIGQVKAPKSVEFVQDLPVTKLGKIDKRLLRGLLLEHLK